MAEDDIIERDPKPDNVIEFVTRAQQEAADVDAYRDAAHDEALSMLERALKIVTGRKTSGIVIAIAFDDGCFAYLTPDHAWNAGLLVGAASTAHQTLMTKLHEE